MFAQAVVEYGALSAIVAGFQHSAEAAVTWIETRPPAAWIAIAAIVAVWLMVRRGR
jgi:hypothetical protein